VRLRLEFLPTLKLNDVSRRAIPAVHILLGLGEKRRVMRTKLNAAVALATCSALFLCACGSDNSTASCTGTGSPANFVYYWACMSCGNPAGLDVTYQSGSSVSGSILLCSGNGACPMLCDASANTENSFTGTVSGNCININGTDGTWSASGVANGNNMQITITSTAGNCFGAQTQTVTVGH
jgi:hypothetical protein